MKTFCSNYRRFQFKKTVKYIRFNTCLPHNAAYIHIWLKTNERNTEQKKYCKVLCILFKLAIKDLKICDNVFCLLWNGASLFCEHLRKHKTGLINLSSIYFYCEVFVPKRFWIIYIISSRDVCGIYYTPYNSSESKRLFFQINGFDWFFNKQVAVQ